MLFIDSSDSIRAASVRHQIKWPRPGIYTPGGLSPLIPDTVAVDLLELRLLLLLLLLPDQKSVLVFRIGSVNNKCRERM